MSKIFEETDQSIDENGGLSDMVYTEGAVSTLRRDTRPDGTSQIIRQDSINNDQDSFFSNMAQLNLTRNLN